MVRMRWRVGALVVAMAITLACAAAVLAPPEYVATGGVLLPEGVLKVQFAAPDPYAAAALVLGLCALWRRRAPVARSEGEFVAELGAPLLAARPLVPQELSRLLLE